MFWQVISGFDASLLVTFVLAGLILNITPGAVFGFRTLVKKPRETVRLKELSVSAFALAAFAVQA